MQGSLGAGRGGASRCEVLRGAHPAGAVGRATLSLGVTPYLKPRTSRPLSTPAAFCCGLSPFAGTHRPPRACVELCRYRSGVFGAQNGFFGGPQWPSTASSIAFRAKYLLAALWRGLKRSQQCYKYMHWLSSVPLKCRFPSISRKSENPPRSSSS